jgi:site-specific DNA recombinase
LRLSPGDAVPRRGSGAAAPEYPDVVMKKLVYVYKVRVVSVTEGIDSANDGWFTLATILGLQHEQYLKTLRANVLRGLIGNLLEELSLGDHCFGYSSVPIEGAPLRGKGRNARPPKKYVIAEEEEKWVRRIFDWYARDRQPIQWIVRELNRQKAPKDHRNAKAKWGRSGVRALLRRIKYIGIWPWGITTNCRDPLTGQIYKELRPEEETQGWIRRFPDLRIIDDETFAAAQLRLDKNEDDCAAFRGDDGKLTGSPKGASGPRHLLQGRIRCAACGSTLYVGGARGQYLICPAFRNGLCRCRTMLPRDLAKRLILEEIGRRILSDEAWRRAVQEEALKAWNELQSTVPAELNVAQKQLSAIEQRIARIVDQIEDGLADPDVKHRLADRRREKEQLARTIAKLRTATTSRPPQPTPEWIDEQLKSLNEVLSSETPAAAIALANLIGDVVVRPCGRDASGRFSGVSWSCGPGTSSMPSGGTRRSLRMHRPGKTHRRKDRHRVCGARLEVRNVRSREGAGRPRHGELGDRGET